MHSNLYCLTWGDVVLVRLLLSRIQRFRHFGWVARDCHVGVSTMGSLRVVYVHLFLQLFKGKVQSEFPHTWAEHKRKKKVPCSSDCASVPLATGDMKWSHGVCRPFGGHKICQPRDERIGIFFCWQSWGQTISNSLLSRAKAPIKWFIVPSVI